MKGLSFGRPVGIDIPIIGVTTIWLGGQPFCI